MSSQALATRGRASRHPAVSMATGGLINTISSSIFLSPGPTLRTTSINLVPSLTVRKP